MEPIDDWMDDCLVQVAPKSPSLPKVQHQPRRGIPGSGVYHGMTQPHEDAFTHPDHIEVPTWVRGGELTHPPERKLDPVKDSAVARGMSREDAEKEKALTTFLNAATAAERLGATDNVTLPRHYARFNIEPIRFICENNLNFFQANITKYILRWDAKNGLEDLQKAKRYLEMFIKFVQKDPDWWRAPA